MQSTSLDKRKIKFLLLEAVHESAVEALRNEGYENIEYLKTSLSEDELVEKIKDVHFVSACLPRRKNCKRSAVSVSAQIR